MSQVQTPQTMNATTSRKSLRAEERRLNSTAIKVSREEINAFLDSLYDAEMNGEREEDGMPWVEAPRSIIEHYNRKSLAGFDDGPQYFILEGVKVYEEGKREIALAKCQTLEQKLFHNHTKA